MTSRDWDEAAVTAYFSRLGVHDPEAWTRLS
jgi:hypothetical protein